MFHIFLICKTEIHRLIIESYDLIFVRGFKLLRHFDYYLRDLHATRDTAHPPRRIDLPSRKSLRNREKSTSPDIGQAFFIYTRIKIARAYQTRPSQQSWEFIPRMRGASRVPHDRLGG